MPPPTVPTFDSLAFWRLIFEIVAPALVYHSVRTLTLRRFHVPVTRDTYVPYLLIAGLWMIFVRSIHSPLGPYLEFVGDYRAPLSDKFHVIGFYIVIPGAFAWLKTLKDLRGLKNPFDDGWEAFFREHAHGDLYVWLTLKSGETYAGFMGVGSRYSSRSKTLYFSDVYLFDGDGRLSIQEGTAGFIVACEDILYIQFVHALSEIKNAETRKDKARQWFR